MTPPARRLAPFVLAVLTCALPAAAQGATLTLEDVSDSNWTRTVVLRYDGVPGERNDVTFSRTSTPGVVDVVERGTARLQYVPGLAAGGCVVSSDGKHATCAGLTAAANEVVLVQPGEIDKVVANLGDRDDRVETKGLYLEASGGDGNDTFVNSSGPPYPYAVADGGPGDDTFSGTAVLATGGDGNDRLTSASEDARFAGGPGDDRVTATSGSVYFLGGPGADSGVDGPAYTWSYEDRTAAVTATPDGVADDGEPGEGDNVPNTTTGLAGGSGPDQLWGSPLGTRLWGGAGDDVLHGGPGSDSAYPGDGLDQVYLSGGGSDSVYCNGDGDDYVELDGSDTFGGPCATVVRTP